MDLVFPIVILLLILSGIAVLPSAEVFLRRVLWGIAVMRSEMLVQAARRAYRRGER